jgi:hypothetical protein
MDSLTAKLTDQKICFLATNIFATRRGGGDLLLSSTYGMRARNLMVTDMWS